MLFGKFTLGGYTVDQSDPRTNDTHIEKKVQLIPGKRKEGGNRLVNPLPTPLNHSLVHYG